MDDLPSIPEGAVPQVEKESPSSTPAPEQPVKDIPTGHEDEDARKIESSFNESEERAENLKQEAREEGEKLAQQVQEIPQPTKPDQETPKLPSIQSQTQSEAQNESTQSVSEKPQNSGSKLTIPALVHAQERARELRAEKIEVTKKV